MEAIEKIVEQILEKGTKETEERRRREMQQIDAAFDQQSTAVAQQRAAQMEKNQAEAQQTFTQRRNRQQLEVKQETLNSKQLLLGQLFKETVTRMNQWDTVTFQQFAAGILEKLGLQGQLAVTPGEYSLDKMDQAWLDGFSNEQFQLVLSGSTVPQESGFVLGKDGVEYNFLFSTLVQEIQKEESYKIAEQLFR